MIRRFVILFCLWPLLAGAQLADEVPVARAVAARSKVFYATDPRSLTNGFTPTPAVVQTMVDDVVMAVTRKATPAAAWGSLVKRNDVVGIKVAAAPGAMGGTHPEVVRAVARGLQAAGVPPGHIVVWDRNRDDLLGAGFSEHDPDFRLAWIDPTTGYDRAATLTAPVLGRLIWGDRTFGEKKGTRMEDILSTGDQLSSTSYYATILSQRVTKVINLPSLCDSFMCGVNGAIANMTLWNVDNWRRFVREPNFGNPFLAEIYADAMIREKVVLTMLDGLALQFAGGPSPNPNFTRQNFTIYASTDPVAIDAVAIREVDGYRLPNKLPPAGPVAGHVETAATMGLGNFEESAIEQIRVGAETPGDAMIDGELLRSVSRSFYLTIRVLPRAVRETIALGYLLARASDCIADTSSAEVARRAEALGRLRREEGVPEGLTELAGEQAVPAEAELLRRLPELLVALEASPDRRRLRAIWAHILEGQEFDLTRFFSGCDPLAAEELDRYTFLVAGSVGEFWTRLCFEHLPGFSRRPMEELVSLGVDFGKGLQLVNILRDRRADAASGRVYVTDEGFGAAMSRARVGLVNGLEWAAAVDNGRVRFGAVVPARIGCETLERIAPDSGSVKIPRAAVRRILWRAVPTLWSAAAVRHGV